MHLEAAALLQSLAQNQAFEDGNKREAVLATFVFLELNGLPVITADDAIVTLMTEIAVARLDVDQIASRLVEWTAPAGA